MVEVDSSYYAMPKPEVAQLWAERTPQDFTFNIKAFRLFTGHQTSTAALPKDVAEALGPVQKKNLYYKDLPREITEEMWRQYREGIEPLKRSGKLAAVHFQFAPWVAYHPKKPRAYRGMPTAVRWLPACHRVSQQVVVRR